MVSSWLPERMLGYHTDDLLGFATVKTVFIRDRKLGAIYYTLTTLAIAYTVFGDLLCRNVHFEARDVQGVSHVRFNHPIRVHKDFQMTASDQIPPDFRPMDQLPYCTQYVNGPKHPNAADCVAVSQQRMQRAPAEHNAAFIPTSGVRFTETDQDCDSLVQGHCKPTGNQQRQRSFQSSRVMYYADIERFFVEFSSSYQRGGIRGTSLQHHGIILECQDGPPSTGKRDFADRFVKSSCEKRGGDVKVQIPCLEGVECRDNVEDISDPPIDIDENLFSLKRWGNQADKFLHARSKEQKSTAKDPGEPDFFATDRGDVFRLSKLLELAQVSLDDDFNADGLSIRQSGTIIEVEAQYQNMYSFWSSFGYQPVRYTYNVQEFPVPMMQREAYDLVQPVDYPRSKSFINERGIYITMKVSGSFGFFGWTRFLMSFFVLAAMAGTVVKFTDLYAIYVHHKHKNYFHLRYDVSPDFSDMWECDVCHYKNTEEDTHCWGTDVWVAEADTTPCGAPRPACREESASADEAAAPGHAEHLISDAA